MNVKHFAIAVGLGLGLSLVLLWVLGGAAIPTIAAPAPRALSDATPIHYVAITGTDSGDCSTPAAACRTVQYAVDRAGEGDEVRVATGVYTGVNTYGGLRQIVYISKTVTVRGGYTTTNWNVPNSIFYPTTLDAKGQGRVLYITGDTRPRIEGLRIVGGDADGLGGHGFFGIDDAGGGIYIRDAIATLGNNRILTSTAAFGGGIHLYNSPSTLNDNIISGNTADDGSYGYGGGLYIDNSNARLVGNTFSANAARYNGGGLSLSGNAILDNNIFTNNQASQGGGLYMGSSGVFNANVFRYNTAGLGGGLYLCCGAARLTNNIVVDNQASTAGGGLYVRGVHRFYHATIARNQAGDGSGVYVDSGNIVFTNTILVSHTLGITVTAGNTATLGATLWGDGTWANSTDWGGEGAIVTGTINLWSDPAFSDPDGGDYHIENISAARNAGVDTDVSRDIDDQVRPMDQSYDIGADEYPGVGLALLKTTLAPYVNPGQVFTFTVSITSAGVENATGVILTDTLDTWQRAIDAASSTGECTITDLNWGGTIICTPGTMITGTVVVVTLTAQVSATIVPKQEMVNKIVATANETKNDAETTTYGQNCHVRINDDAVQYTTVQAAVDAANPGDVLKIAGICLGAGERAGLRQQIYLDKSLTVRGGYTTTNWNTSYPVTQSTTLDALRQGRVLYVAEGISPTVEGLHITGGDAAWLRGHAIPRGRAFDAGGGVYVGKGTVILSNTWVFSNVAELGGGVYLAHSVAPLLNGNVVNDNFTQDAGGGLYLYDADAVILNRNVISGNTSYWGNGAGLGSYQSNNVIISNNVFDNNTIQWSYGLGAGLYLSFNDNLMLSGNTINGNTGPFLSSGGAHIYSSDNVTLSHNIISNNASEWGSGGIAVIHSHGATFESNIVIGNVSEMGSGGGLKLSESDNVILSRNTIYSNTSSYHGGGLYLSVSDATLVNNIIADNRANSAGSGIYVEASSARMLHTTVAHNVDGERSGIYIAGGSTAALTNTILVSYTVGITVATGNTVTLEATLWGDGVWANDSDWGGDGTILTGTHNYWGNPAFVDPDAGNYHTGLGSAALDRGINAGVTTDIDGDPRPMGLGYDIGADEFPAALHVTKQANPDLVQDGEPFAYTIRVTNTGDVDLRATITDVLPQHIAPGETPSGTLILPGGVLTWTALVTAPGGVWAETLVVTAEMGYAGPLTNVVRVATAEGATGVYTTTSSVVLAPANQAPYTPSSPDPADDATDVPLTQTLQWQGGDPDDDPVTYTVAFGSNDPPPPVSQVQTTSYDPGGLVAGTTYYWAITASDGISSTAGPTWRFTTEYFVYLPVVLKNHP